MRVHQNILARQQLPVELVTKNIWRERFEDINAYERYLSRQGVLVRKFFLHVSKEEQRQRFLERLDEAGEALEVLARRRRRARALRRLHAAYEDMIRHTVHRVGAVVRDAGRSQVVHAPGRLGGDHRCDPVARSALPRGRSEGARRVQAVKAHSRPRRPRPSQRRPPRPRRPRRSEALLVAGRRRALRPVSRRRMGTAGHRRSPAVREDLPRRFPVRA